MKKTIEELKTCFIEYGCELLEDVYVDAHTKMKYRCVCGNESSINWNNFRSGKRCGCGRTGVRRLTEEEIIIEVTARGCSFISAEFVNNKHLITCLCRCGSERICELKNLRKSKNCERCRNRDQALTFQYVQKFFADQGCRLLDEEYRNARTKLRYVCSCSTESAIVFDSFRRGNRCQNCGNRKISEFLRKRTGPANPCWIKDRNKKRDADRFCQRCRTMVKQGLKRLGLQKNDKSEILLGYKFSELQKHIESFPSWNILKNQVWHIDHIFPLKAFTDYGILDFRLANCFDNLQPLSGTDNVRKQAKYDRVAFETWLESKNTFKKGGV